MDYGHTVANTVTNATTTPDAASISGEQTFFTAGVGDAAPEQSPFEPENDLNTGNWSTPDALSPAPEREHLVSEDDIKAALVQNSPDLFGQADSLELGEITTISTPSATSTTSLDPTIIRADGDHISRATLREVEKAEQQLNRTHDLHNFYDEIRNMTTDYLNNTFTVTSAAKDLQPIKPSPTKSSTENPTKSQPTLKGAA